MKKIILALLIISASATMVMAGSYQEPTCAPSATCNAEEPINNSLVGQYKVGGLTLNYNCNPCATVGLAVANGNTGIGITNPLVKLHISGASAASGEIATRIENTTAGGYSNLYFTGDNNNVQLFKNGSTAASYGGVNSFNIYQSANAPIAFFTSGNNERMRIAGDGNVGIGTISPAFKLHVSGTGIVTTRITGSSAGGAPGPVLQLEDTTNPNNKWNLESGRQAGSLSFFSQGAAQVFTITQSGSVGVGVSAPGYKLDVNGDIGGTGFYYRSDESLKNNIAPLSDALSKVLQLQGVSFNWKDSGKPSLGVVAQDVEKVYPELVNTDPKTGLKSVEYGNLVAPLIEAIKTQQNQNDAQQKEIDELKAEIKKLKK